MISTVLVDLDDTLLRNDINNFLPAYLDRLGAYLNDLVPAELMIPALLRGTRAMLENQDPERLLHQVFADVFYPELNKTEASLRPRIDEFYAQEFPVLRTLTEPFPEARDFVASAIAADVEIVIATNPLFPRTAITQRLDWAGVPAGEFTYSLITSYDNTHFCKPSPAYYAEVLGQLGRSPLEAAMVGNHPDDDLKPAHLLGMPVFLIGDHSEDGYPCGSLRGATAWLQLAEGQADLDAPRQPTAILALLQGDLAALLSLTTSLDEETWTRRPSRESWAPVEVVCHLRDVEIEVNLPRLEVIRSQPNPFLSASVSDDWAKERGYLAQNALQALGAFTQARKQTIAHLQTLAPDEWSRTARHSLLGPTTLAELMAVVTEHDRIHLAQIRACIKRD